MSTDLADDIVELVACPLPSAEPVAPLREMAFRSNAWSPGDLATARTMFAAEEPIAAIAAALGRGVPGVADKLRTLGLRRNCTRPWSDIEDAVLFERYGATSASQLGAELGRSCGAVYLRASLLGLQQEAPPPYDAWEDAQIRAGYAAAVPVGQIATLIGRPLGGVTHRAGVLGLNHPAKPVDWSDAELARALELAQEGYRYLAIIEQLVAEGFPRRTKQGFGPKIRRIGYGRGWGRRWTEEEDEAVRRAYANGDSLTPLQALLGRNQGSIAHRAKELGLQGTHVRKAGWRTDPDWSEQDLELLRTQYGKIPTPELARQLGRSKPSVYTRANVLGLVHGRNRAFSADDDRAILIGWEKGLSLRDVADALGRDQSVITKRCRRVHGLSYSDRPTPGPRGPRCKRPKLTVTSILELGASS